MMGYILVKRGFFPAISDSRKRVPMFQGWNVSAVAAYFWKKRDNRDGEQGDEGDQGKDRADGNVTSFQRDILSMSSQR
jgi:hypothetical protein